MAVPAWIRSQLAGPKGWLGGPVASFLDRRNRADYLEALECLGFEPGDHVLELGFGGGVGLDLLLKRGAVVTGVEPMVDMRVRAYRRFAEAAARGELTVADGAAEALPDGPFTASISMNTVYFWTDVERGMAELRRVVTSSVVLGVSGPDYLRGVGFEDSGFRVEEPAWYGEALGRAGFDVELVQAASGITLVCGRSLTP